MKIARIVKLFSNPCKFAIADLKKFLNLRDN